MQQLCKCTLTAHATVNDQHGHAPTIAAAAATSPAAEQMEQLAGQRPSFSMLPRGSAAWSSHQARSTYREQQVVREEDQVAYTRPRSIDMSKTEMALIVRPPMEIHSIPARQTSRCHVRTNSDFRRASFLLQEGLTGNPDDQRCALI
ncbi:hypothetical protein HNQ59_001736 [Chitinivorax tropicus]|uniref:Uncharacterized protein n=1 Tax=Chitinivorax tropicus TaxID=714531 RepID=A0A840MN94_9PROT|nr:hypothetical protein [Chitinivorax tropicus]